MQKMRKDETTIMLARIRAEIRRAIKYYKKDDGIPHFYSSWDYKSSHRLRDVKSMYRNPSPYYYVRSNRAINMIAIKISKIVTETIAGKGKKRF